MGGGDFAEARRSANLGQREWNVLEAEVTRSGEDDRRRRDVIRLEGGDLGRGR